LRKEGRRNEYERHKLQALNQRQKLVGLSAKNSSSEKKEMLFREFLKEKERKVNSILGTILTKLLGRLS
jgi:hypothetical protein